jgi:hypothetical protein
MVTRIRYVRADAERADFSVSILKGEVSMKYIPISSKQISFVSYDDQASQIHIQYHAGQTQVCSGIHKEQVQSLLKSDNPYDFIMRLAAPVAAVQEA